MFILFLFKSVDFDLSWHRINVEREEMSYSCMGICYAKLFEAAKSIFKSCDSHAV